LKVGAAGSKLLAANRQQFQKEVIFRQTLANEIAELTTALLLFSDEHTPKQDVKCTKVRRFKSFRRILWNEYPLDHNPGDQWFKKYAGAAAGKILDFCKAHEIVKEVKEAVLLAEKCFQVQPSDVCLEEDIDPETDDKQIVIAMSIRGKSREEVLAAYHSYIQQSISILPWPKSSFIGLSYDIS
jgi:hypothetical protein